MTKKNLLGAVVMVLFLAGTCYAQDGTDQSGGTSPDQGSQTEQVHHGPSQAAIDACSGKSEGDTCDYTNSKGDDKSGACATAKDGQTVFCKRSKSSS